MEECMSVQVSLERYFSDERARVLMAASRGRSAAWLARRLRRTFQLPRVPPLALRVRGYLLPPGEPLSPLLQPGDVVEAIPASYSAGEVTCGRPRTEPRESSCELESTTQTSSCAPYCGDEPDASTPVPAHDLEEVKQRALSLMDGMAGKGGVRRRRERVRRRRRVTASAPLSLSLSLPEPEHEPSPWPHEERMQLEASADLNVPDGVAVQSAAGAGGNLLLPGEPLSPLLQPGDVVEAIPASYLAGEVTCRRPRTEPREYCGDELDASTPVPAHDLEEVKQRALNLMDGMVGIGGVRRRRVRVRRRRRRVSASAPLSLSLPEPEPESEFEPEPAPGPLEESTQLDVSVDINVPGGVVVRLAAGGGVVRGGGASAEPRPARLVPALSAPICQSTIVS